MISITGAPFEIVKDNWSEFNVHVFIYLFIYLFIETLFEIFLDIPICPSSVEGILEEYRKR